MRRRSACRQLLIGTSMSRYLPPMGTAGLERCCVSGNRRDPCPPPRMIASTSFISLHDSHKEEDQLEDENCHNRRLEHFPAHHAEMLDGEAVDIVEGLQLFPDAGFPSIEVE